jgi:hypothetical protein
MIRKVDSFLGFPRNAVQPKTEAFLTAEIETRSGEPGPYDRPRYRSKYSFIKVTDMLLILNKSYGIRII